MVRRSTLKRFPETLLGSFDLEQFWDDCLEEYFFERNVPCFEVVLYYYQSKGIISIPQTISPEVITNELKFFRIGNDLLWSRISGKQLIEKLRSKVDIQSNMPAWRKKLWLLFSDPLSSRAACYLHYFDTIMIMIAIASQCMETMPEFEHLAGPPCVGASMGRHH